MTVNRNEQLSRRRFLSRMSLLLSAAAGAVVSIPILGYLLSPLIRPAPQQWIDVGAADQFALGKTVEVKLEDPSTLPWSGATATTAAWVRRTGQAEFIAFSVNCTHLGCPVNWQADAEIFLCPCHGGVYYSDGTVAGGPPPRPLFRYDTRVGANGHLMVRTRPLPVA